MSCCEDTSRLDYNERGGRVAVKHSASFAIAARRNSHESWKAKTEGRRQIERQSSEFSGQDPGYRKIPNGTAIANLPSGKTWRIFKYDVVSRMTEALSSCEVIAAGSGSNLANSQNSVFSFSRRVRAAFLLFSFMAHVLAISAKNRRNILLVLHTRL